MEDELKKVGFADGWVIHPIRNKFGIFVFRITKKNESYVGKYFGDEQIHGRQEINHYQMLNALGVPTLKVITHTDCLLLLEDVSTSNYYRLGVECDMSDVRVVRLIGSWFNQLHTRGKTYDGLSKINLLENVEDELSHTKIKVAIEKSGTGNNPIWDMLMKNIEEIKRAYFRLCNTITYNDFWWDNLAVAKDFSAAIMFDYNCVYRKYSYVDVRHVLSILSEEASTAFIEGYGEYDAAEKVFEDIYRPVSGLIEAYNMDVLPPWANNYLQLLHRGELIRRIKIFENFLYKA